MFQVNHLIGFGAASTGLNNSFALTGGATTYLGRTLGAGTRTKFAISYWVKAPSSFSSAICILGGTSNTDVFGIDSTGHPTFLLNNGTNGEQWAGTVLTTSAYNHVLYWVDTANGTAGDRLRVWINGTEEASFGRDNNPTPSEAAGTINNSAALRIGRTTNDVLAWANTWTIEEIAFFDNNLPTITQVRDSSTSKPKDLTGLNFGSTGFWLRFEGGTAATVGTDSSGLGNSWTGTNIVDGDLVSTVP
mgnify:CR=1 FL=1